MKQFVVRSASLATLAMLLFAFAGYHQSAIVRGQMDSFESDTTEGWQIGLASDPNAPVVVDSGGIGGAGDGYLLTQSTGTGGPGSKLVFYNDAQWTGNYIDAGINLISMHLNNLDTTELVLRLRIESDSGGAFDTRDSVVVPPMSGWVVEQFSVSPNAWFGGPDVDKALRSVNRLRVYHGVDRFFPPSAFKGTLGLDNITALGGGVGVTPIAQPGDLEILEVYPNPSREIVRLEVRGVRSSDTSVAVHDLLGRHVRSWPVTGGSVDGLAPGVYWIRVVDGTAVATRQFVVGR